MSLPNENLSDNTSAASPYRFWINDDDDETVTTAWTMGSIFTEHEQDDKEVLIDASKDCINLVIDTERDLEDLARLWITTPGLTTALKSGTLRLGLKWTDVDLSMGSPAVRLFKAVETNGGNRYLFNPDTAALQIDQTAGTGAHGFAVGSLIEGSIPVPLPTYLFANTSESQPNLFLLFEGTRAGTGQLKLVILDQSGQSIGEFPGIWLDLKEPKEFVERWSCGDGDANTPVLPVVRESANSGTFTAPATDEQKDYLLYVHGYNMQEYEKQRWIETTFKRLYHLGYKGRVAGFTWPCAQSFLPFDDSEARAWEAGVELKNLLSAYKSGGYRVHVLAHSQGNIVVGEALRQWKAAGNNTPLVSTYIASQAAIAAHCYDPAAPLIPGFAGSLSDDGTPNVYLTYPPTSNPYLGMAATSGTATRFRNFQNPGDWALTGNSINPFSSDFRPIWQAGQRLKPDHGFAYNIVDGFLESTSDGLRTLTIPNDRFRIFSYVAEARSLALGSTETDGVFAGPDTNLATTFGYGLEHKWHSGQFRSNMAARFQYWNQTLIEAGLKLPQ